MTDPTKDRHIFRTFLGIVPDVTDPPICGAKLPDDWQVGPSARNCPACEVERIRLIAEAAKRAFGA